jgi:hypothetical protein
MPGSAVSDASESSIDLVFWSSRRRRTRTPAARGIAQRLQEQRPVWSPCQM